LWRRRPFRIIWRIKGSGTKKFFSRIRRTGNPEEEPLQEPMLDQGIVEEETLQDHMVD